MIISYRILLQPSANMDTDDASATCSFLAISISIYTLSNSGPESLALVGSLNAGLSNLKDLTHSQFSTKDRGHPLENIALATWCSAAL